MADRFSSSLDGEIFAVKVRQIWRFFAGLERKKSNTVFVSSETKGDSDENKLVSEMQYTGNR